MRSRRWLLIGIAGLAGALLIGRGVAGMYAEYLWYSAMGAGAAAVWRDKYTSLLILRIVCGVIATAFVFVNLYAVRQSVVSLVLPRRIGNLEVGEEVPRERLTWIAAGLSLVLGLGLAWPQDDWTLLLAARIGLPFGEADPYFNHDIGFFVHWLPFELDMFEWALTVALLIIGVVVLLYALTPSLRWERGGLYVSGYVRRHLAMLAGTLLVLLAWHYRLEMFTVLARGSLGEVPFGYLDHRVGIPASLVLAIVTLGAGLVVLWGGWTGQMRVVFAALTGVLLAVLVGRQIVPFVAGRVVSGEASALREQPYEATRASYTRRAFAVDLVQPADSTVAFATLADAAPHVPVWDEGALRAAGERGLAGAGIGWTSTDSGVAAVLPTSITGASVTLFLATAAERTGTPLRVFDAESRFDTPPLLILPDSADRPLLLSDTLGEIAAPGVEAPGARLAFALSQRDVRFLVRDLPGPDTRLLARRTVRERVGALAPFLAQGSVVSPIWFNGSLTWSVDLYASSRTYPLSRHVIVAGSERSYLHHAATALVNAHTGRTVLVADTLPDPITQTWLERFPDLFVRPMSLPVAVRRHLPPPREGARAQASAFGRYGTRTDTDIEERLIPDNEGPDSALVLTPEPLMLFPQAHGAALVLPLVDRSDQLQGLFIALGGEAPRTLWYPLDGSGIVWNRALDRLRAVDTVAAAGFARGYVRTIPVDGGVALVQPRFEMRRGVQARLLYVNALVNDSVHTAPTLVELTGLPPVVSGDPGGEFRPRVTELYEQMREALRQGDWTAFGHAFDALGVLLRQQAFRGGGSQP